MLQTDTGACLVEYNVASTGGPIPEPASWALMIGGFGLVGGALRRRRLRILVTA